MNESAVKNQPGRTDCIVSEYDELGMFRVDGSLRRRYIYLRVSPRKWSDLLNQSLRQACSRPRGSSRR